MLIKKYDLEVFTPPCSPGSESHVARLKLNENIASALPYLNAELQGADFQPEANALSWKNDGRHIVFHANEINISDLEDRKMAEEEVRKVIDLVNNTWERRAEIEPDYTTHKRPAPMALFKLLPQTNCRECGEPTCFSFALKLAAAQRQVSDCPPLEEAQFVDAMASLQAMVPN